jgi:AbiTii
MSVSLIEQLQAEATQRSVPITDLLRKAKLAGAKLGRIDLIAWVDHELSGYLDIAGSELPTYRQVKGEIKFRNPYKGWQSVGLHVEMPFVHPIGEIVGLISNDSGYVMASVPTEFADKIRRELGVNVDVRFHASCSAFEAVVEGIRNAVLDWAVKLELAGVRGDGISFSPAEAQRAQSVNINIGSIGNAVGLGAFGDYASISGTIQADSGQLARRVMELVKQVNQQLAGSGLSEQIQVAMRESLAELREAASMPKPEISHLRGGLQRLLRVVEGSAGNLIASGAQALIAGILNGASGPTFS